jgi:leucyl aminopeptidase (aminopeptidase T)
MMERLVDVDLREMKRFTSRLVRLLRDAKEITVENPEGTRISFSVEGRKWVSSLGDLGRPGSHGNLPAGECYTAPVEASFTGRVVLSLIDDKIGRGVLEFERGRLVRWSGRGVKAVLDHVGGDATGRVIGEFGVGTNRGARICPNMLEAEKAFGTVHFAIGDSYGLGRNASRHHYDALVERATIRVGGRTIARNGRYLV